jgi:hypothetical protein
MNDHQKDTDFLKRLIHYEDSDQSRQLEERISTAEKEERVVRGALGRVALLAGLSLAGMSYAMILLPDFPQNRSQFILKLFLALGLASFISLVTFAGLWVRCRAILDGLYGQCRDLVSAAFERSLKRLYTIPFPRRVQPRDEEVYQNQTVAESEGDTSGRWQKAV